MLPVTPVKNAEGRGCSASGGVTTEDIWVQHGTTWWTASLMDWDFIKSKVGSNLQDWMQKTGHVDDLTRWTHERCYDERILEWCLGYNTQSKNVVSSKWISKIKYATDRSKEILVASLRKRELILKRHLLQEARYSFFRTVMVGSSMMN